MHVSVEGLGGGGYMYKGLGMLAALTQYFHPQKGGGKNFDPQFSALTLDLGQNLTLTFDQNLTTPIGPAPRHFTAYSCAHVWTMGIYLDP